MPSHPDRVRHNYHMVEAVVHDIQRECRIEACVGMSRQEITSWVSGRMAARALAEHVYRQVLELFPITHR